MVLCALYIASVCFECLFSFAFVPSPLKLITCNKQWWNSVLLSSPLKFWVLALNYKCPPKKYILLFLWLFHEFPYWNLPKFSQHITSNGIQSLNTNKVPVFCDSFLFSFCKYMFCCNKTCLYRFPWKMSSD